MFGKCQPDAFRAVGGSTGRVDPDNFGRQEAFGVIGDFNSEQDVFAQGKYVFGRNEKSAVFEKWHIAVVEQGRVFKLQRHHFRRNVFIVVYHFVLPYLIICFAKIRDIQSADTQAAF